CNTLSVPSTRDGILRSPRPREGKSSARGRVRITDLPEDRLRTEEYRELPTGKRPIVWLIAQCLNSELTDRIFCGLNLTSASRLFLSRIWQPGSILALVLSSDAMTAGQRKGAIGKRLRGPGPRNALFLSPTSALVKPSFSFSTLSVPNCHATQRLHEGWDTARLPKPRQEKSRGRGWVRTTNLPKTEKWNIQPSLRDKGMFSLSGNWVATHQRR
ncbi:hypothetical protein T265_15201, partial [Opisthorchis viverrini]